MKPFEEDLEKESRGRLDKAGVRLGVTWDDLKGVESGEVALAVVQPDPKNKMSHATVLIIDATGKEAEAKELLEKIAVNQASKRAMKSTAKAGDIEMTIFTLPPKVGETVPEHVIFFLHHEQLVLTDSQLVAK